ncbi:MAG: hypothetical protein V4579_07355 [Pseudomonadota bacterium]
MREYLPSRLVELIDAKHEQRQQMCEQFRRSVIRAKLDPAKVTPHVLNTRRSPV